MVSQSSSEFVLLGMDLLFIEVFTRWQNDCSDVERETCKSMAVGISFKIKNHFMDYFQTGYSYREYNFLLLILQFPLYG